MIWLTLRVRASDPAPARGELFAASAGPSVYRVVAVTRFAGATAQVKYRVSLERLRKSDIPPNATPRPWPAAPRPPRPPRATEPETRRDPSTVKAAIRRDRDKQAKVEAARAAAVGRDGLVETRDYGHAIQRATIRGQHGEVIREAEVEVEEDVDPNFPRRKLRRARRNDPIRTLLRTKTISDRHYDAALRLRFDAQSAHPPIRLSTRLEVLSAPPDREQLGDRELNARRSMRKAFAGLTRPQRRILEWIVIGGGSLNGYAVYARIRRSEPPEILRAALDRLAEHYFGVARAPARAVIRSI